MRNVCLTIGLAVVVALTAWHVPGAYAAECCGGEGWVKLFNGSDLEGWRNAREPRAENKWLIEDGAMTNVEHGHDIATVKSFKDFGLRLEYKTVPGGNSGVYLRGRIEVQVLDSFGKQKPGKGDDGAIYDQFAPLVNASKPVGEWNQLEACIVGDTLTVKLNGQVIHDKRKISEVTGGALPGKVTDAGPLLLQGDHGKVWYRNIEICETSGQQAKACCAAGDGTCPKTEDGKCPLSKDGKCAKLGQGTGPKGCCAAGQSDSPQAKEKGCCPAKACPAAKT